MLVFFMKCNRIGIVGVFLRKSKNLYRLLFKYHICLSDRVMLVFGRNRRKSLLVTNILLDFRGAKLKRNCFSFRGSNCQIVIGKGSFVTDSYFDIGDDCTLLIGENVRINGARFGIQEGSKVCIGSRTALHENDRISALEGTTITIGDDCNISHSVSIRSSDSHSIISGLDQNTGSYIRINKPQDVVLGDHIWIGEYCSILKGSVIGQGSVIGAHSVLTQGSYASNSLFVGIPASQHRGDISWDVKRV